MCFWVNFCIILRRSGLFWRKNRNCPWKIDFQWFRHKRWPKKRHQFILRNIHKSWIKGFFVLLSLCKAKNPIHSITTSRNRSDKTLSLWRDQYIHRYVWIHYSQIQANNSRYILVRELSQKSGLFALFWQKFRNQRRLLVRSNAFIITLNQY